MKKLLSLAAFVALAVTSMHAFAQKPPEDKTKRPSPPDSVTQTISSGATVTINYGAPSLRDPKTSKERTVGKDVEPMAGKVWRAGANEATTFEVSKDVTINGKALPAGKYAFFTIDNGATWTLIFNKVWDTWGAYDYEKNKASDALKVSTKATTASSSTERLKYNIDQSGKVSLMWGNKDVSFLVK